MTTALSLRLAPPAEREPDSGLVGDTDAETVCALSQARSLASSMGILGDTPGIRAVREQIHSVSRFRDVSVLVLGETGTGKELVARAIHALTAGPTQPLVAVNCAAVPESLFESELFGHEAGAYTGARGVRVGLLEAAAGGTVFLDEIGEMPLALQPKLLRALEARAFRRVGSNRQIALAARVVSATNRLPFGDEGALRPDLYYRLAGFTIRLPALRDRIDDVATLASSFARAFAERHHVQRLTLTDAALGALRTHSWPGNVRELRAVVEQAAMVAAGGEIGPAQIASVMQARAAWSSSVPPPIPKATCASSVIEVAEIPRGGLRDVERHLIARAHEDARGNVSAAAKALGIPRTTLRAKLLRWGLIG